MISVILDGNGTPGEIGVNDHPALFDELVPIRNK